MNAHDIILRPIITEKNTMLMEQGKYTFEVAQTANKPMIKQAVQELFNVRVTDVNTLNVKGKMKTRRTRTGLQIGYKRNWKKAVVTLAAGETIDIFEDL